MYHDSLHRSGNFSFLDPCLSSFSTIKRYLPISGQIHLGLPKSGSESVTAPVWVQWYSGAILTKTLSLLSCRSHAPIESDDFAKKLKWSMVTFQFDDLPWFTYQKTKAFCCRWTISNHVRQMWSVFFAFPNFNHPFQPSSTINLSWLVVWTPLKNIGHLGWLFPTEWKNKIHVPVTTNQYLATPDELQLYIYQDLPLFTRLFTWFSDRQAPRYQALREMNREISPRTAAALCSKSSNGHPNLLNMVLEKIRKISYDIMYIYVYRNPDIHANVLSETAEY